MQSGGASAPGKCFLYLMDFECINNKWKYKQCIQSPGEITLLNSTRHDNFSIKVKMEELIARVRRYDEQWLTTPGDLQQGAGGQRSTVLRLLDEGNQLCSRVRNKHSH